MKRRNEFHRLPPTFAISCLVASVRRAQRRAAAARPGVAVAQRHSCCGTGAQPAAAHQAGS